VSEGVAATAYLVAASALALWLAPRMGRPENQLLVNGLAIGVVVATSVRLAVMTHMWETPPWSASVDRILGVHERSLLLSEQAPDIYYIVLDGMSRLDTLRGVYGIEVGAFAYGLAARGFSVAAQSSSNYSQTHLSLASALNMTYLDDLAHSMGDSADRTPLRILVQRSRAISRLRDAGYEFVMIGSDYSLTITHPQADRCDCALVSGLSELESALIDRSPFRVLSLENHTFGAHSRKVLHSFDSIAALRRGTRPMLVFAHILSPHPPFVLNKDGRARWPTHRFSFRDGNHYPGRSDEYVEGYRGQAQFIMARVLRLIDEIRVERPGAVIILHGDHGSGLRLDHESVERSDAAERLSIFTALRLPYADTSVPADLTPVNVLRLVFNRALGAQYEMLPNRRFMSSWERPYRLIPARQP
jgi:hypothetical protein